MRRSSESFNMFGGERLNEFFFKRNPTIQEAIHREAEDYILNVNETEYINYLVQMFEFDIPHIDFDSTSVSDYETQISPYDYPEHFHFHFASRSATKVDKQVVVYHLPFTGDSELFRYAPSQHKMLYPEVFIENH